MKTIIRQDNFAGEKVEYPDGIGCCIWEVTDELNPDFGICLDFAFKDINKIIALLEKLKKAPAEKFE